MSFRSKIKELVLRTIAGVLRDCSGKVVFYHDVFGRQKYTGMGTPLSMFQEHILTARVNGWQIVDGIPSHDKELMICFDDGFHGLYDCRDDLKAMSLHPTVFIAVNLVGKDGYLTWDEIRELQDKYGYIFESHTWSHQTLVGRYIKDSPVAERTDEWFTHELEDSRTEIGRRLCKDVTKLCFPAGCFSDEIVARCLAAGYKTLFVSYPSRIQEKNTAIGLDRGMIIPRHLVQHSNEREFSAILHGALLPFKGRYLKQHHAL